MVQNLKKYEKDSFILDKLCIFALKTKILRNLFKILGDCMVALLHLLETVIVQNWLVIVQCSALLMYYSEIYTVQYIWKIELV